ncbi:gliding motility lipoprotein GldB [Marivirga arenosa]|uniref:Gliding motility lipoprotein GldB n=1 Tax=Marivirga arenosa TaxID=3059076 RepID=A0AA51N8N3_9BACT|nr:gliding motility lipoprotein GldB [Marivirga sp. ABR2-2]WMN07765.1 gliding motility lipoprotein GldB [Marivirga sp. ABR2-2]
MQKNIYRVFSFLLVCLSFYSCSDDSDQFCDNAPNVSGIEANIKMNDLTDDMVSLNSEKEALRFIDENPFIADYFFERSRYGADSIIASSMINIFSNPSYKDTLYQQVKNTFGDFSEMKNEFESAFKHYKYYYPDVYVPNLEFVLAGLRKDLFVSDSLISVAADYFLGSEAAYVPNGIPDYILMRYEKEYIVPMTMLLLTQKQNQTDQSDNSLLADMVFYGKSYYMTKMTIPCTPDSLLIGYTAKEMEDINKNEHIIWANFLENDLLYETSHFMKNKFIGERPKTFEISQQCPGRIGIWVGWQIVKAYMKNNPEVTVQELMENTDAQDIFSKSRYKPKG